MKTLKTLIVSLLILTAMSSMVRNPEKSVKFVPDTETASKIAEAIWLPIYGEKVLNEKPFIAKLRKDGVWVVEGTLKNGMKGGVAYIEIQSSDCRILEVTHGK